MSNFAGLLKENIQKYGEYKQFIYVGSGGDLSLTNIEIENRACRLASSLKNLDVKKGDVIAVILVDMLEIPPIINGIIRAGAVFLPIIPGLTVSEIRRIICDSKTKVIITEDNLYAKVEKAIRGSDYIKKIISIGSAEGSKVIPYKYLIQEGSASQKDTIVDVSNDDLAMLIYNGANGFYKGIMLTHGNLISSMKLCSSIWPYDKRTRGLIIFPMNNIFGICSYFEYYIHGCTTIFLPKFNPSKVLDTITDYQITTAGLVPSMLIMMMQIYDTHRHSMNSIDMLYCGGAFISKDTLMKATNILNIPIYQAYGMSETCGAIVRQTKDRPLKYGAVGHTVAGTQLKIVDAKLKEFNPGIEGDIICKGPSIMKGYYNRNEETKKVIRDGWLLTGDIGKLDNDGELYFIKRKKMTCKAGI